MKTNDKHTPTPWELHQDEDLKSWFIWAKGNMAASLPRRTDGVDKANAEFIVRAVNSHEALLNKLKHAQARLFVHEGNSELYDEIGKAIAQAEGGRV